MRSTPARVNIGFIRQAICRVSDSFGLDCNFTDSLEISWLVKNGIFFNLVDIWN